MMEKTTLKMQHGPLEGDFPTTTGTFKQSQFINLQAYKTDHTYIAWVYDRLVLDRF
jgi:hypothetical protein